MNRWTPHKFLEDFEIPLVSFTMGLWLLLLKKPLISKHPKKSVKGKGKAIDFTSPRTSSDQACQPYETVPSGTISSLSEGGRKPQGENHQALAVKGERHPTCGLESNPGRSGERQTCYHGAKPHQLSRLTKLGMLSCLLFWWHAIKRSAFNNWYFKAT